MGLGPVTAGFKASFMESSGTTITKTITIEHIIHPPISNLDSCGIMWYYYVAPSIQRSQWRLCDFNGDTLLKSRNLFFFTFERPQIKTMTVNLAEFSNSPKAYDLTSYENRQIEYMNGM